MCTYFRTPKRTNANHQTTIDERKAMAVTFVNEKFPAHGITRISERIIMYRHDYNSSNILQVIYAMPSIILVISLINITTRQLIIVRIE